MKKYLLLPILLITAAVGQSQIKENETLVYAASYNMNGLMTRLAQVTLATQKVNTSKKTFLHLKVEAATYSKWDSYFKIRDVYESYVNPATLQPSLYKRSVQEGGYTKTEKYIYQSNTSIKSTSRRRNGAEKNNEFSIQPTTTDIVAVLYKIRTLDYPKYTVGQQRPVTIVFDEKEIAAHIKYIGKQTLNVEKLGKVECYKLAIAAQTAALKGTDKNIVWITADGNRIPVRFQFSIPVGTGELNLTEVK
jgi:hypothetical protein